jgi:hypothetical protein
MTTAIAGSGQRVVVLAEQNGRRLLARLQPGGMALVIRAQTDDFARMRNAWRIGDLTLVKQWYCRMIQNKTLKRRFSRRATG